MADGPVGEEEDAGIAVPAVAAGVAAGVAVGAVVGVTVAVMAGVALALPAMGGVSAGGWAAAAASSPALPCRSQAVEPVRNGSVMIAANARKTRRGGLAGAGHR